MDFLKRKARRKESKQGRKEGRWKWFSNTC
jgi:hypothetical protein